ncbi:MAG: PilW family protein [Burkholderiales bacterium]
MTNPFLPATRRRSFLGGFSLVELMIAITLGLLIMTGLISVFVKNSLVRAEIERGNRQIESGRYAMSLLTDDLRMAGYFSSFNPYNNIILPVNPPLAGMASMPDPCATSVANLNSSFFFHVQGYDYPYTSAAMPTCLSDVRTGSDILVIRRVSTCVAGPTTDPGCDAVVSGDPYFQASSCYQATELAINTGSPTDYQAYFVLDTNMTSMTKHAIDCTTIAPYRRYLTHIYFVANNDNPGDGIPTLKRAELGPTGFTIVPLVEGIETVQFEYGVDTNGDGVIDGYTADPNSYNACAGAACVSNWLHTYAVTINLLARNIDQSPGYTDTKTYTLGLNASGGNNIFGPYSDAYRRHAYTASVRLSNPSGRVMP